MAYINGCNWARQNKVEHNTTNNQVDQHKTDELDALHLDGLFLGSIVFPIVIYLQ